MIVQIITAIFSLSLFINAALFIPQIIQILKTKSSLGLSPITFGGFCLIQASAVAYGYIQKDYVLMFGFGLSILTCGIVTALIFYYRERK